MGVFIKTIINDLSIREILSRWGLRVNLNESCGVDVS
jgi:hypothetical protein